MSLMKIMHVVGARPNFMKESPVMKALNLVNKSVPVLWDGKASDVS